MVPRIALATALGLIAAVPATAQQKLGPSSVIDALRAQPDAVFPFIVRGNVSALSSAKAFAVTPAQAGTPTDLPIIDGILLLLKVRDADMLSQRSDIAQVYYVRAEMTDLYVSVIQGLSYAWQNAPAPGVANMSLGPYARQMPYPSEPDDPMNAATERLADKGFVIVMAIGNYFTPSSPNPGVTNPWCKPDWVICVGAANVDATALYDQSARGASDDPTSGPDVVAYGLRVMSRWPAYKAKSAKQIEEDEESAEWRALPDDRKPSFAVMSGTSQATGQVSRSAAQLLFFMKSIMESRPSNRRGDPLFSLEIPASDFDTASQQGPRLIGSVTRPRAGVVEVRYPIDEPWKLVKQVLMDTAKPMADFKPQDVGAGFVSPDFIDAQFGRFNVGQPKGMALKVFQEESEK